MPRKLSAAVASAPSVSKRAVYQASGPQTEWLGQKFEETGTKLSLARELSVPTLGTDKVAAQSMKISDLKMWLLERLVTACSPPP